MRGHAVARVPACVREHDLAGLHAGLPVAVEGHLCGRPVLVDLGRVMVDAGCVAAAVRGRDRLVTVIDDPDCSIQGHLDCDVVLHEDGQKTGWGHVDDRVQDVRVSRLRGGCLWGVHGDLGWGVEDGRVTRAQAELGSGSHVDVGWAGAGRHVERGFGEVDG